MNTPVRSEAWRRLRMAHGSDMEEAWGRFAEDPAEQHEDAYRTFTAGFRAGRALAMSTSNG